MLTADKARALIEECNKINLEEAIQPYEDVIQKIENKIIERAKLGNCFLRFYLSTDISSEGIVIIKKYIESFGYDIVEDAINRDLYIYWKRDD
jgi:hypothetical protein